jgi:uncharacterized protein DUF5615
VREAIEYGRSDPPEIAADIAREEAIVAASGQSTAEPEYISRPKILSAEEWARLLSWTFAIMRLYLDDDSVDSALIRLLTAAGHDVLIPAVAGTAGQEDAIHLMRSIQTNRSFMTRNYDDFKLLHDLVLFSGGHHPGILVVRRDNDPSRDMSNRAIVQAGAKSPAPAQDSATRFTSWITGVEKLSSRF